MALYEQLSTPSQRFSYSAPASTLPLPPYNAWASVPVPSASPSQGGSLESSMFSPFYMHHSPAQSAEMVQSRTFDANNYRSTRMELVRRSAGHANQKSSNAAASVVEFSTEAVTWCMIKKLLVFMCQQRVFAVQVFELHRLIKVQKLIAASPNLLLEENPYLSGSPQKVTDKNLPPEPSSKPQPLIAKRKDHSQKPSDNTVVPPLPFRDDGPNKSGLRQLLRCAPYTGDPPPSISAAPEHKQTSWCYPSTNQWLVPVISPSEGLIYKPYTGHCSPAAGFMAPFHGICGPLNLPLVAGDLMNAAYGTPAIAPNYFPPRYGFPVVNPIISALPVEQVGPIAGSRPAVQIEQWSRSSLNMAIPRSEAFSGYPWRVPTSKDSELQGSTASSPCERAHAEGRDAPPLIPTRVIKVVPRNARSATESVTRIFQSIQEERQQCEP